MGGAGPLVTLNVMDIAVTAIALTTPTASAASRAVCRNQPGARHPGLEPGE